jgi:hypothetical protein
MNNPAKYTPYHEMIARRAHEIWERSGRPAGSDQDHWLQAEKELAKEAAKANPASKPAETKRRAGDRL